MALRELIGQILLKSTALTPAQLAEALEFQEQQPERDRIGAILVSRGTVSPLDLLHALGHQWGLPVMETIPPAQLDRQLVMGFPFEFLQKHAILPLAGGNGDLVVALADPLNVKAFDAVANALRRPCTRVLCTAGGAGGGADALLLPGGRFLLGDPRTARRERRPRPAPPARRRPKT